VIELPWIFFTNNNEMNDSIDEKEAEPLKQLEMSKT
jgi:hypothetical protein